MDNHEMGLWDDGISCYPELIPNTAPDALECLDQTRHGDGAGNVVLSKTQTIIFLTASCAVAMALFGSLVATLVG